jgi:FMN-dependent NADH-azoreductase
MRTLLAIDVSPRCDYSTTRKLTVLFVDKWREAHSGGYVVERDLVKTNLPFVDLPWIGGAFTPPEQHSPESAAAIRISNDLVFELQSADHIVIGTPMYNFSIPARLKAYIDHIVRVGITVVDNVGQLTGKKATIILATGGDFSPGSPFEAYNHASGYLRQVLGFLGISDLEIILAGAPRAGMAGEHAIEQFGEAVSLAAAGRGGHEGRIYLRRQHGHAHGPPFPRRRPRNPPLQHPGTGSAGRGRRRSRPGRQRRQRRLPAGGSGLRCRDPRHPLGGCPSRAIGLMREHEGATIMHQYQFVRPLGTSNPQTILGDD